MDEYYRASTPRKRFNINFDQAVIDNPWRKYPPEQLEEVATHFKFTGLEDLFRKAARYARDPGIAHKVSGLTDAEREALESESKITFWAQPKQLKIAILTCCLRAVIQGWNQTGSNGANMHWPVDLKPKLHVDPITTTPYLTMFACIP